MLHDRRGGFRRISSMVPFPCWVPIFDQEGQTARFWSMFPLRVPFFEPRPMSKLTKANSVLLSVSSKQR